MWSGFSSEIETSWRARSARSRRMWSGFSSEIETVITLAEFDAFAESHVERLLI